MNVNTVSAEPQANRRSTRDFRNASRHSYLVGILKKVLPAGALAILLVFGASVLITYSPVANLSIESTGLEDGKLVMNSPKMAGFDKNKRPYDVKATRAIQDLTKPGIIELESIDATLPMDAKSFANVDAESGTYDTNKETLVLRRNVVISGARGMDINLETANIDMKSGSMTSDKPVKVVSKDTNLTADAVSVEDNGKRIVFKNRVRMTIKRPVSRGTKPDVAE